MRIFKAIGVFIRFAVVMVLLCCAYGAPDGVQQILWLITALLFLIMSGVEQILKRMDK